MIIRYEIPDQLADLRSISNTVGEYLDRELFKESFGPEDYGLEDILLECYSIVLSELYDYGLYFIDEEHMLGDWPTAKNIYFLRYIVELKNLFDLFKKNDQIVENIANVIDSEETPRNTIFRCVLEELLQQYPDNYMLKSLNEFNEEIYNDNVFIDHVKNILELIQHFDSTTDIVDINSVQKYMQHEVQLRDFVYDKVEFLVKKLYMRTKLNVALLHKLRDTYDQDKWMSGNIKIYSIIDRDTVPESLEAYKKVMMDAHHARSPHHAEYWVSRPDEQAELANLIYLVANIWEPDETVTDLPKKWNEFFNKIKNRFEPDEIDQMKKMYETLLTYGQEDDTDANVSRD